MIDWNGIAQEAMVVMTAVTWILVMRIVARVGKFEPGKRLFLDTIVICQAIWMVVVILIVGALDVKHTSTIFEWIVVLFLSGYYVLVISYQMALLSGKIYLKHLVGPLLMTAAAMATALISHSGWLTLATVSIAMFGIVWFSLNDVGFGANYQAYFEARKELQGK